MALDQELEALIATLPADQQGSMRDKITKGYLRQEDYSRLANDAKRAKDEAEALARSNAEWWEKTGEDSWRRAEARNAELEARAAELERQVAASAAGTGNDAAINAVQLDARVKAEIDRLCYMSTADTEKLVKEIAAQTRKEAEEAGAQQAGANMAWAQDMAYVRMKYENEFKEELDREKFAKFMTDNGLAGSPSRALEAYTAPRRQEQEVKAKVEAARTEERDRVMKEMAGRAMPGSAGTGTGESSPAVRLLRREDTSGFVLEKNSKLGNGDAAAAAAARLVAAGKF